MASAYVKAETPRGPRESDNRLEVAFEQAAPPPGEPESKQTNATDGRLVPFKELFGYADATDKLLMAIGTAGAVGTGIARPGLTILFGSVINSFNPAEDADVLDGVKPVARNFVIVGVCTMIAGFLQVGCWSIAASRQAKRIRAAYVNAIITKEIGWFDVNDPMELSSRVAASSVAIQEGIGAKVSDAIHFIATVFAGIVIGFIKGWELALVLLAAIPFLAVSGFMARRSIGQATQNGIAAYGKAGAVAQESLSNIRTVHMFNAVDQFVDRYSTSLEESTRAGIKKSLAVGVGMGTMQFFLFCTYALGFFVGAVFIANDQLDGNTCTGSGCYDGGRVLTIFFAVLMGSMALGQAGPCIQAIFSARAAAYDVFEVIRRPSLIDPTNKEGKTLPKIAGRIDIQAVSFAYPSRPEVQVCSNYSLSIAAGETVALVGPSGSGKSTVISLLERFYDPLTGAVKIDGEDIRNLNVRWLRQQVGLVGQEPVLFATTIMENIRSGRPGATDSEVVEAAKMANAFSFISEFPEGFATEVGERGTQLSGGQKQRIAIARAIIKNPPILLLDEATSALDTESERIVQESLDKLLAGSKRTTIIVAHRLSTIRGADRIAVHSNGRIVELGSHDELIRIPNGHYALLLAAQDQAAKKAKEDAFESLDSFQADVGSDTRPRGASRKSSHSSMREAILNKIETDDSGSDTAVDGEELENVPSSRIWKLSAPEWKFMVIGCVATIVNSAVFPSWGFCLAKITTLFFDYSKTKHEMLHDMRIWVVVLLSIAVAVGTSNVLQRYGFGVTSERLIARVRRMTFSAMLRQDVGWFDLKRNSSGALISRLATDSAILQATTSDFLYQKLVQITTLSIALAIAFAYSWQITLIMFATIPLMVVGTYFRFKQVGGKLTDKKHNDADAAAGSLLSEAIDAIRTVASFSMEQDLTTRYVQYLEVSDHEDRGEALTAGAAFGYSQGINFLSVAFVFYIGAIWVSNGHISFSDMFVALMTLMMSTFSLGMASQDVIDSSKAKRAAINVFSIIDRVPPIDATDKSGKQLHNIQGHIEFRNLQFTYPSRPDSQVYSNYSLSIQPGQTVALVGASGSGKSTAISLLERFYDPTAGSITLDGTDIRELSLPWLRDRISLVSQEPVLFSGTIADNIAMGRAAGAAGVKGGIGEGGSSMGRSEVTREEIEEAAKRANAYDFIVNFPDGFDTDVGDRGAQVSGGQKQRIAIARAILRDPDVLLLDEATSALDNESERVVQASLDALLAAKKRTTIVVAHRLSTVRNADVIAVTSGGEIVERGSHEQLMRKQDGIYRRMVEQQASAPSE